MNRVYIETDKRKFFLSYVDVIINYNTDILIGLKKSLMTFEYSERESVYKKFYDYSSETQKPIFEVLKKICVNNEIIYQVEGEKK